MPTPERAPSTLLERANALIPWGTQTRAKRVDPRLAGVQPPFIERAQGCRVYAPDGRCFIDFRSALGAVALGYRHPDVDAAVRAQLDRGVIFSMASPLETEVAEALHAMIPGLEQMHFLKSGNEATTATLRLARAHTGRAHVVTCGYHGHGDWFSAGRGGGAHRFPREGNGVPEALDELVTPVAYGDTEAAEAVFARRGHETAALIMVPYDWGPRVAPGFVRRMRELTREHGALLVLDEVLTGFRLARGGGREHFGVQPDLATYSKAIANGLPLSVFGGRAEVMARLDQAILTSTFGGETLSLAAAAATLRVMRDEPVVEHLWSAGARLQEGFDGHARALGLPCRSFGLPPVPGFRFSPDERAHAAAEHEFFRALYERGIFPSAPFFVSYAHGPAEIEETVEAFGHALERAAGALPAGAAHPTGHPSVPDRP